MKNRESEQKQKKKKKTDKFLTILRVYMRGTGILCSGARGVKTRFSFAFLAIECAHDECLRIFFFFFNTLKTEIPSDILFLLLRTHTRVRI